MMGAVYTVTYVAVPLLVVPFLIGSSMINVGFVVGIAILAIGSVIVAGTETAAPGPQPELSGAACPVDR